MSKTLLFIPCYNCEKQIVRVLAQIDTEVLQIVDEVIVVNNRSTDNTENAVLNFIATHPGKNISLLRNDDNYGLGGSHKVAFGYAIQNQFDRLIVLHGDDQGNIKDAIEVLQSNDLENYDCLLGARFIKGSKLIGYSKFRQFGNWVFNTLFSIVIGKKVYDLGSGLNIYNVSMLQSGFYHKFADNLTFNCHMLLATNYYKQKIKFFPISWREEDQVSNVKMTSQAIKTFTMLYQYLFAKQKFITSELRERSVEQYTAQKIEL